MFRNGGWFHFHLGPDFPTLCAERKPRAWLRLKYDGCNRKTFRLLGPNMLERTMWDRTGVWLQRRRSPSACQAWGRFSPAAGVTRKELTGRDVLGEGDTFAVGLVVKTAKHPGQPACPRLDQELRHRSCACGCNWSLVPESPVQTRISQSTQLPCSSGSRPVYTQWGNAIMPSRGHVYLPLGVRSSNGVLPPIPL